MIARIQTGNNGAAMSDRKHPPEKSELVLSYLAVRQCLGLLGLSLPVSLYLYARVFGGAMQPSVSEFYYTAVGDWLVGTLCAIGVFLFAYKGYATRPPRLWLGDREIGRAAGLLAVIVALFPISADKALALCQLGSQTRRCAQIAPDGQVALSVSGFTNHPDALHLGAALGFFLCLAYFCFVLFPMGGKRSGGRPALSGEHATYYICGTLILIGLAMILLYFLVDAELHDRMKAGNWLFWWETLAIMAFSASWLAKGRFLQQPFGLRRG